MRARLRRSVFGPPLPPGRKVRTAAAKGEGGAPGRPPGLTSTSRPRPLTSWSPFALCRSSHAAGRKNHNSLPRKEEMRARPSVRSSAHPSLPPGRKARTAAAKGKGGAHGRVSDPASGCLSGASSPRGLLSCRSPAVHIFMAAAAKGEGGAPGRVCDPAGGCWSGPPSSAPGCLPRPLRLPAHPQTGQSGRDFRDGGASAAGSKVPAGIGGSGGPTAPRPPEASPFSLLPLPQALRNHETVDSRRATGQHALPAAPCEAREEAS